MIDGGSTGVSAGLVREMRKSAGESCWPSGVLPASLKLRREIEDIAQTVATKKTEAAVRKVVEDLNERIRRAQRGHLDGPPVVLSTVDADEVVAGWRSAQAGGHGQ